MLSDAVGHAEEDARLRSLRELGVDADRLLEATQTALSQDGGLLLPEDRVLIESRMTALSALRQALADADALRASIAALSAATEGFAAQRMDNAVRQALAGRRIDDLEH